MDSQIIVSSRFLKQEVQNKWNKNHKFFFLVSVWKKFFSRIIPFSSQGKLVLTFCWLHNLQGWPKQLCQGHLKLLFFQWPFSSWQLRICHQNIHHLSLMQVMNQCPKFFTPTIFLLMDTPLHVFEAFEPSFPTSVFYFLASAFQHFPSYVQGEQAIFGICASDGRVPSFCPITALCSFHHLLPFQERDVGGLSFVDRLAYEYGITISDLGAARWLNKEYPPAVIQTREYRSPEVWWEGLTWTLAGPLHKLRITSGPRHKIHERKTTYHESARKWVLSPKSQKFTKNRKSSMAFLPNLCHFLDIILATNF